MVAPTIVWVTKPNGLSDCLWFWNLRALRSVSVEIQQLVLLPDRGLEAWVEIDRRLGEILRRPDEFEPDVLICGLRVGAARLDEIARILGLRKSTAKAKSSRHWPPPPLRQPPFTYRTNLDPRQWLVYERGYGEPARVTAQLFRTVTRLSFASPVSFSDGGFALVRLSGPPFDRLPRRPSVARLVQENSRWHHDSIEFAMPAQRRYSLTISIPSAETVVDAVLRDAVVNYSLSTRVGLPALLPPRLTLTSCLLRESTRQSPR